MPDSKSTDKPVPDQSAPAAPHPRPKPRRPSAPAASTPAGTDTPSPATPAGRRPPRRSLAPTPKSPALADSAGPDPDTPLADVRLAIGSIGGPHGVEGELRMRLSTDEPDHLRRIKRVWVGDEAASRRLLSIRFHQGLALIRLSGVRTPDDVKALIGQTVRISGKDARPLQEGEFYYYQAIGITAYDEAGNALGTVTDILETGANDVFVITPAGGGTELLIPNTPSVVLSLEPAAKRMTIRPLVYWGDE